jgi:hypothetical protein
MAIIFAKRCENLRNNDEENWHGRGISGMQISGNEIGGLESHRNGTQFIYAMPIPNQKR